MSINLKSDPIYRSFLQYLLPALTGMIIKSLFIMGDAWFIGQGVGAQGLGAISLIIPAFSVFVAVSMMIGIGGASLMSIEFGKGNKQIGQVLFNQAMLFTAILSTVLVVSALVWIDEILLLMGATGEIAQLANDYLSTLLLFFVLYSLAWVLSCFVRNDTNPKMATYAMSIGAIVNLILDYFFVIEFGWGMKGAAFATGLAQLVIAAILMSHFIGQRGQLRFNLEGMGFDQLGRILKIGTPIFFIEITSAMTVLLFNYVLLTRFSESHIIAYGLTANVGVFALFTMVGISQACQPIISFNYGAGQMKRVNEILWLGLYVALGGGVLFLLTVWLSSEQIARLYLNDSLDLIGLSSKALFFYFMAVPLMGLNIVIANLFQAIAKPMHSSVISLGRGFVFVALGVIFLPGIFPENGIWSSILFAETVTALLSVGFLYRFLKSPERQAVPA